MRYCKLRFDVIAAGTPYVQPGALSGGRLLVDQLRGALHRRDALDEPSQVRLDNRQIIATRLVSPEELPASHRAGGGLTGQGWAIFLLLGLENARLALRPWRRPETRAED